MKTLIFFAKAVTVVAAFAVLGCQSPKPKAATKKASWGTLMPVQAGALNTAVPVGDFLEPGESADLVVYAAAPGQADTLEVFDGQVVLPGAPPSGIGLLSLTVEDAVRVVPVLSKGEQTHSFTWDANTSFRASGTVEFVGDLTGWTPVAAKPVDGKPGVFAHDAVLRPGNHPYQWVVDGEWILDPTNPNSISNGMGGRNSVVAVKSPQPPSLEVNTNGEKLFFTTDGPSDLLITADNILVHHGSHDQAVTLPAVLKGFGEGRHHVRAWAARDGGISQDVLIPMEGDRPVLDVADLNRSDWHSATMYFLMVDRFVNGNPDNDEPVDDPRILPQANHFGGDLDGVVDVVESGYFRDLGMNTVWISPITANAEGAWGYWQDSARTDVTSRFSGYHGYWPVSCTEVDRRLGSRESLTQLTDRAHAADMNVVLDYVANHVHEDHPLMEVHPDWTTDLYLPDGSLNTERWDDHRLTTWFDTFMPTLDLERPEVAEAMSDSATWWAYHSGIDGFRHDATKHISEVFWRKLTAKLKAAHAETGTRLFQIGETYGSPDLIGSYLSSGMLDAQFDFNLYDKAVGAIAFEDGSWEDVIATNRESLAAYGAHHLMGNITGNQDRPRFTSLADGTLDTDEDMKFQGWTRDIQHGGDDGYAKMRLLMSYLMSVPGIPCVYYGDEIADVGGNDPDNRRMMRFADLNAEEHATRDWTATWANLRRSRMSMLYGTTEFELVSKDLLRIRRSYLGESTDLYLNRGASPAALPDGAMQPARMLAGLLTEGGQVPAWGAVAFDASR